MATLPTLKQLRHLVALADNRVEDAIDATRVVFGIAPWNAPVILGVRAVATPLAWVETPVRAPMPIRLQMPPTRSATMNVRFANIWRAFSRKETR